jgi:hypothetical protein
LSFNDFRYSPLSRGIGSTCKHCASLYTLFYMICVKSSPMSDNPRCGVTCKGRKEQEQRYFCCLTPRTQRHGRSCKFWMKRGFRSFPAKSPIRQDTNSTTSDQDQGRRERGTHKVPRRVQASLFPKPLEPEHPGWHSRKALVLFSAAVPLSSAVRRAGFELGTPMTMSIRHRGRYCDGPVTPSHDARARPPSLRRCGFSENVKTAYCSPILPTNVARRIDVPFFFPPPVRSYFGYMSFSLKATNLSRPFPNVVTEGPSSLAKFLAHREKGPPAPTSSPEMEGELRDEHSLLGSLIV